MKQGKLLKLKLDDPNADGRIGPAELAPDEDRCACEKCAAIWSKPVEYPKPTPKKKAKKRKKLARARAKERRRSRAKNRR